MTYKENGKKDRIIEAADLSMEDTGRLMTAGASGMRRKKLILIIAAAVFIAAIGIGGFFLAKSRQYNEQISIAEKCLQEGDYTGAEAGYAAAVKMNGRKEKGHKGLAYTYVLEDRYEEASRTYLHLYDITSDEIYKTASEETSGGMTPSSPELFPADDLWISISEDRVTDAGGMKHFIEMYLKWQAVPMYIDKTKEKIPDSVFDSSSPEISYAFPLTFAFYIYNDDYNIYPEYADSYVSCSADNNGNDPRGWSEGVYQKIEKKAYDTVYSDLFNVEKSRIPDVLAEAERRGIMYLDNGYYYEFTRGGDLETWDCSINSLWINNSRCMLEYTAYATEYGHIEEDRLEIGTYYAVMDLKEINGTMQWTMLYNGPEMPEEMKGLMQPETNGSSEDTGDIEVLKEIEGKQFIFASGAGGWDNTMTISSDGSFSGVYHDTDMGADGDRLMYCSYNGKIGSVEKISDYEYDLIIEDITPDKQPGTQENTESGITMYTEPYGLENISKGSRLRLLMPGYQTSGLSEEAKTWFMITGSGAPANLEGYGILNEEKDYLFLTL